MRHANKVLLAIVLAVVLPAIYLGSYLALMQPMVGIMGARYEGERTVHYEKYYPEYTFGGEFSEWIFAYANRWDRRLRPHFWNTDPDDDSGEFMAAEEG